MTNHYFVRLVDVFILQTLKEGNIVEQNYSAYFKFDFLHTNYFVVALFWHLFWHVSEFLHGLHKLSADNLPTT